MKNTDKTKLTPEGLQELEKELDYRKNVKKKELSDILGAATEKGDLSENDEYNIVLEDTLVNDARIRELTDLIKNSEIVKHSKCTKKVQLGCKVRIQIGDNEERIFQIVGETEANPTTQKISITSPIGKGVLGKSVGEKVDITTPRGTTTYTIVAIEH